MTGVQQTLAIAILLLLIIVFKSLFLTASRVEMPERIQLALWHQRKTGCGFIVTWFLLQESAGRMGPFV